MNLGPEPMHRIADSINDQLRRGLASTRDVASLDSSTNSLRKFLYEQTYSKGAPGKNDLAFP